MGMAVEMQTIDGVNVSRLVKALGKFELFMANDKTEQERAGIVQAFEYCFELSWKIMKRLLDNRGQIANSPRETFRMAALEGFVGDPELWFDFLKKRNLIANAYNENYLNDEVYSNEVLSVRHEFAAEIKAFLKNIGAFNY